MAKVRIVVDSSSDIPPELAKQLDIVVVPMPVNINGKAYLEGVNLSTNNFYPLFADIKELPKTSQPNLQNLVESYNQASADGSDIIAIHLSSGLSGTVQTARLATEMVSTGVRIEVLDSLNASLGIGLLAVRAAQQARDGNCLEQIVADVKADRQRLRSVFTPGTLEYLIKGGRVSKVSGAVGTLLDIKPLLHVTPDGKLESFGKIRGRKPALRKLAEIMATEIIDSEAQTIGIAHADCRRDAEYLAELIGQSVKADILIGEIGCTIGSHTGPGCIALFYRQ